MNDQFQSQKDILVSLKHEISLLHQQVDYLLRNEKELGLLDLDVMMNRTHTIYDKLCSINLGGSDDDVEVDPEMLQALFGSADSENEEEVEMEAKEEEMSEENNEISENQDIIEEPKIEETVKPEEKEETDFGFIFKMEEAQEEVPEEMEETEGPEEVSLETEEPERPEEPKEVEEPEEAEEQEEQEEKEETEEVGEPEETVESEETPIEEVKPSGVYTTGDQIEMEIPHLDLFNTFEFEEEPEEEEEEEVEEIEEPEEFPSETEELEIPEEPETEEEPEAEEEPEEVVEEAEENVEEAEEAVEEKNEETEEEEPEIAYEPIIFGEMEEADDGGFEFEGPETLGERMQHEEDHSLAARLQSQTVNSLRSAIGINDKFLFVNELFGGSMEKYNRSIENLDDVKTLNGALIYLNELRIELQWNSNNEAYKKLLELVHRKFE